MTSNPTTKFAGEVQFDKLRLLDGVVKWKCCPIVRAAATTSQDTGFDLPLKGIVLGVYVDVKTAEVTGGTKTLDVGLLATESGGDLDGFLNDVSVAATGVQIGKATITSGASEDYFASTTRGVLMSSLTAGTNDASDVGTYYEFPHVLNGTAKSLVYAFGSNDFAELVADIWVHYVDMDA